MNFDRFRHITINWSLIRCRRRTVRCRIQCQSVLLSAARRTMTRKADSDNSVTVQPRYTQSSAEIQQRVFVLQEFNRNRNKTRQHSNSPSDNSSRDHVTSVCTINTQALVSSSPRPTRYSSSEYIRSTVHTQSKGHFHPQRL